MDIGLILEDRFPKMGWFPSLCD